MKVWIVKKNRTGLVTISPLLITIHTVRSNLGLFETDSVYTILIFRSGQASSLTTKWRNAMKNFLDHFFVPIGYVLAFTLILSTVQAASLPQDIEIDITTKKITSLLEAEKYLEALPYFEQLEAMKVPLPESFYYFKIKSLDKTTDTKKTLIQAQSYFTNYGKDGKYYNAVVEIYSRVSMRNAKEEAIASELRVKEEEVVNALRMKEEAIANELRMKKIEDELAQKKRIENGWQTISSTWSGMPASNYSTDCSEGYSLIKRFHTSARNTKDCNCTHVPSQFGFGLLPFTVCNFTWQRNSLLEGGKSLHEFYKDEEIKPGGLFKANVKVVRFEHLSSDALSKDGLSLAK